ncbi:MSC_0623 family F1-like ATPase-associated protein [Mycoplasmopsis felis]|uniref:MSC_0623 family F1-like ATPase-associated protein n=1 Tax=Mycoplasmopsis felis TaxID=33923 RepID=UPI002AFDE816|nr:DUF2714 domain-containing protein [Mycoplasmopsis felis]WQQ06822.1 DUF2714 domain-containing protein [Mycoplasmopsis felis]
MSNQKKELTTETQELFDLYADYKKIQKDSKFISYKKLLASILLRINSSFNSTEFQNLSEQIEYAIANKYDILFDEFTVNFNLVPKYSTNVLVPTLSSAESSTNEGFLLTSSTTSDFQVIVEQLNKEIWKLLGESYFVEFLPKMILFVSSQSGSLKLFFDKSLTAKI